MKTKKIMHNLLIIFLAFATASCGKEIPEQSRTGDGFPVCSTSTNNGVCFDEVRKWNEKMQDSTLKNEYWSKLGFWLAEGPGSLFIKTCDLRRHAERLGYNPPFVHGECAEKHFLKGACTSPEKFDLAIEGFKNCLNGRIVDETIISTPYAW